MTKEMPDREIRGRARTKRFNGLAVGMKRLAEADPGAPGAARDSSNLESHTVDTSIDARQLRLIFTLEYHTDGRLLWYLSVSFWDKSPVSDQLCLDLCNAFFDSDESGHVDVEERPGVGLLPRVRHFWQERDVEVI